VDSLFAEKRGKAEQNIKDAGTTLFGAAVMGEVQTTD